MKIYAVGGYNEVGKNMTAVNIEGDSIAIDNGIRIDVLQMYDMEPEAMRVAEQKKRLADVGAIPDMTGVEGNILAQVISHGHLDHIGAVGINNLNVPLFATPYASVIGRRISPESKFNPTQYKKIVQINNIGIEFVEVTHSIPQASIVVLHTKEGNVVYANDFKLDDASNIAKVDYGRLKEIGKEGVKTFITESLNAHEKGKTSSESVAARNVEDTIKFADDSGGLTIVSTFSTHIERIKTIFETAHRLNKKVVVMGKSLISNLKSAEDLSLIKISKNTKFIRKINSVMDLLKSIENKKEEYLIIATGHQGEEHSVLSKIVNSDFKFDKNDSLIFSSNVIPTATNIANREILEAKLKAKGVKIFGDVHVSGHASKEEHRRMINLLNPEIIIPSHGTTEMKGAYMDLACEEGYKINKNIFILNNGDKIEI
ncbi:MAG: MBL fold metallo-hydrolase RNA specificity domain-containing protein [Candidatus Altarchaeum sp.]|nr:MBL fold metallo-hydrolase RNA specificity domain-containing protein [Candidatus Altarchaeum sp.]